MSGFRYERRTDTCENSSDFAASFVRPSFVSAEAPTRLQRNCAGGQSICWILRRPNQVSMRSFGAAYRILGSRQRTHARDLKELSQLLIQSGQLLYWVSQDVPLREDFLNSWKALALRATISSRRSWPICGIWHGGDQAPTRSIRFSVVIRGAFTACRFLS